MLMPFPKEQNHCLLFHRGGQYLWLVSIGMGSNIPRLLGSAARQQHTGRCQHKAIYNTRTRMGLEMQPLHGITFHPCISNRAGPRQSLTVLQRSMVNVHHLCWIAPVGAPLNVLEKQLLLEAL